MKSSNRKYFAKSASSGFQTLSPSGSKPVIQIDSMPTAKGVNAFLGKSAQVLILSLIAIFSLSYLIFSYQSNQLLSQREELASKEMVQHEAHLLNNRLQSLIVLTKTIAQSEFLKDQLRLSNQSYQSLSAEQSTSKIAALDGVWRQSLESSEFVQNYLKNDVSVFLNQQKAQFEEGYGEIFLTNAFGAMIGTTGKLTTLAHQPKYWWQGAYNNNSPRIFIDDRGFDYSVKDFVVGIVVPIVQDGTFLGVLKSNFRMSLLNAEHLSRIPVDKKQRLRLVRSTGEVIPAATEDNSGQSVAIFLNDIQKKILQTNLLQSVLIPEGNILHRYVAAPVPLTWLESEEIKFGGKKGGIDQYRGHESHGWFLVLDYVPSNTLSFMTKFFNQPVQWLVWLLLISAIVLMVHRFFTQPMQVLQQKVLSAVNEPEHPVWNPNLNFDEFSGLETAINQLNKKLNTCVKERNRQAESLENYEKTLEGEQHSLIQDPVTKLLTPFIFEFELQRLVIHSNRHSVPLALLVMHLDHFENIEDIYGVATAEQMVIEISQLLVEKVRRDDVIAYWQNGEFAILMPTTTKQTAVMIAERIQQQLRELEFDLLKELSISAGLTEFVAGDSVERFMERAHQALSQAKDSGRNRVSDH